MRLELTAPARPNRAPGPRRQPVAAQGRMAVVLARPRTSAIPAARPARHADAPPRLATPKERPGCAASRAARKARGNGGCEPEGDAPTWRAWPGSRRAWA